ncbi:MAG: CPBP family intramembrane glutamic endopeptidase [Candidatus Thorarchaeota archaeon]
MNINNNHISAKNRFIIVIFWSISTLFLCYLLLFCSVIIFGLNNFIKPPQDQELVNALIITLYTCIPLITAIIFKYYFKNTFWEENLIIPKNKLWFGFGLFYVIIVLIPTLIVSMAFGLVSFNQAFSPFAGTDLASLTVGNPLIDITMYIIIVPFLSFFDPGGFIRIIGEEYGWRGYLLPETIKSREVINIVAGFFFVGIVWMAFHIPFFTVLSPLYPTPEETIILLLGCFGVFIGASLTLSWSFLKTHSIIPALSLHYIWNIINPVITGNLYSNDHGVFTGSLWLINGEGLIGGIFHLLIGLMFLFLILKDKDKLLRNYDKYLNTLDQNVDSEHSFQNRARKKKRSSKRRTRDNWEKQILR